MLCAPGRNFRSKLKFSVEKLLARARAKQIGVKWAANLVRSIQLSPILFSATKRNEPWTMGVFVLYFMLRYMYTYFGKRPFKSFEGFLALGYLQGYLTLLNFT